MPMMTLSTLRAAFASFLLFSLSACNDATPVDMTPAEVIRVAAELGSIAPSFTAADTAGRPVALYDFRGKVVLIDFWATWCAPCIADLPSLKERWERYRDQNFVIVGVSLDTNLDQWRSFLRDEAIDWVNIAEGKMWDSEIAARYKLDAIPASYLLDRNGRIMVMNKRGAALDSAISQLLRK